MSLKKLIFRWYDQLCRIQCILSPFPPLSSIIYPLFCSSAWPNVWLCKVNTKWYSMSGFLRGHWRATALLKMTEDFRASLDNKDHRIPIAVDLSKAFGAISHRLLISKIKAYGFTENPVNLIRSFLCDRFQRVKIGNTYSDWRTIQHGVSQGSIFRPLLFNLFINDLTYSVDDAKLRLYADDTTLYLSHPNQDVLESRSQSKFDVLQSWFKCKYLNMNESKTNHWMTIRHTTNCLLTVLGHPWRWYTIWSY